MIDMKDAHLGGQYDARQQRISTARRIKGIALFLAILTVGLYASSFIMQEYPLAELEAPAQATEFDTYCTVTRVVDGDTIECDAVSIRLLGIDAPEIDFSTQRGLSATPGGISREGLLQILNASQGVGLRFESRLADVYGRVLAKVYLLDGTDVGQLMIDAGLATYRESY